jgi:AcrR family transcriptional regulator
MKEKRSPQSQRQRRSDGIRTFETIVNAAADLASREGLDSLTIGSLAARLAISKSGLFAHFGSKDELQLATVEAARKRYVEAVLRPAMGASPGLARLESLCANTIEYLRKPEFPGGCFFVAVQAGARASAASVHDAVIGNKNYFRHLLVRSIKEAQARREIEESVEPEQMAYELVAVLDTASWSVMTSQHKADIGRAEQATRAILERTRDPGAGARRNRRRPTSRDGQSPGGKR